MPGFVIHLAIGKIYSQKNKIEDMSSFEKGIIAPDILEDKKISHYGPNSSNPNLKFYIDQNRIWTSYQEGYFLHLITDFLFYNKFLKKWETSIYEDYDILNKKIIKKYDISVLEEIKEKVKFKEGNLSVLNEDDTYKFIEFVGNLNIRQILLEKNIDYVTKMEKGEILEKD